MGRIVRFLVFTAFVLSCTVAFAQPEPGKWYKYPAYHNAVKCIRAFSKIFVLSDGSLYSFDERDSEIHTYDYVGALNDNDIADIAWCSDEKAVVICYNSGNIDLLYENDNISNIPDLIESRLQDTSVNDLIIYGCTAWISTNSGLIKVNLRKKEITDICSIGNRIRSAVTLNGNVICSEEKGIFTASESDNLKDPSNWTLVCSGTGLDGLYECNGTVFVSTDDRKVCSIDFTDGKINSPVYSGISNISTDDYSLYVVKNGTMYIHNRNNSEVKEYTIDIPVRHVLKDNNTLWISSAEKGLSKCTLNDNNVTVKQSEIMPDSPVRNYFDYMEIAPDGSLLVAGGSHNYIGVVHQGTLMKYNGDKWINFPEDGIEKLTGLQYKDLTSIVEDPEKPGHFYASSFGNGVYEYKDYKFCKLHSIGNSPLCTILPGDKYELQYIRVNGLKYDNDGNLWMLNQQVDTIFRIMKNDGKWASLYYPELSGLSRHRSLILDSDNLIWTASSYLKPGLFCADTRGTLFDSSDDVHYFSGNNFINQDNVSSIVNDITFFEIDHKGIMWIGTDQGLFVLENRKEFIKNRESRFKRIKVARNDGTGLADYLLSTVYTTAICIDAGNRKWIGTSGNGIFLISEDGTETISHFTTENSPLISDNIMSIKINSESGEVFIGTDKGLVSFGGNAFKPNENLEKSNVTVFPNPVLPEYEDMVTVKGLTYNSTVKILNSAGRIIDEGKSQGGGFTWYCRNGRNRVPSGIYYIMVVDEDGNSSIVSSVTVIK